MRSFRSLAILLALALACAPPPRVTPVPLPAAGTLLIRVTALRTTPAGAPIPGARAYLVDSSATPAASDAYRGWPTLPRRLAPQTTYVADTAGVIRVPALAPGQRALVVSALGRVPAIIRVQVRPALADTVAVPLDIIGCECP